MGLVRTFKMSTLPVIDGIVARGRDQYAIAIKKTSGNILLDKGKAKFFSQIPLIFIRGIISFFESTVLACKTLSYSANYFDKEEKSMGDIELLSKEEYLNKQDRIKAENSLSWLTFSVALVLILAAIAVFFIAPVYISSLFFDNVREDNWIWFNTVTCSIRLVLFIMYFVTFRFIGGTARKFREYHAAANKARNCFEAGKELTLENVKAISSYHPRSGVYIFFLTVVISSVALVFFKLDNLLLAFLIRLLVVVLAVNISYEISRLFGMFNGKFSRALAMIFGMWIEGFAFSKPDDMKLYVAITAVKNSMIEG